MDDNFLHTNMESGQIDGLTLKVLLEHPHISKPHLESFIGPISVHTYNKLTSLNLSLYAVIQEVDLLLTVEDKTNFVNTGLIENKYLARYVYLYKDEFCWYFVCQLSDSLEKRNKARKKLKQSKCSNFFLVEPDYWGDITRSSSKVWHVADADYHEEGDVYTERSNDSTALESKHSFIRQDNAPLRRNLHRFNDPAVCLSAQEIQVYTKLLQETIDQNILLDLNKMSTKTSTSSDISRFPKNATHSHLNGVHTILIPAPRKSVNRFYSTPAEYYKLLGCTFNFVQYTVYKSILSLRSMLVCAPTGTGKTNVAVMAIHEQYRQNKNLKVLYVAPTKSLVTEIADKVTRVFSFLRVQPYTSDTQPVSQGCNVVVGTPEKIDLLSRRCSYDLLIIDEIHLLDSMRGPVIEALVARSRIIQCRVVGLSATLPNYEDVAEFIGALDADTYKFEEEVRPCLIEYELIALDEQQKTSVLTDKVLESSKPVLIFVNSRAETLRIGQLLTKQIERKNLPAIFADFSLSIDYKGINKSLDPTVRELLWYGVGIHHAGLSKDARRIIEELFRHAILDILVCTGTLAWGVNLPAQTVIVYGSTVYSPTFDTNIEYSRLELTQMFGRAGRAEFVAKESTSTVEEHIRRKEGICNNRVSNKALNDTEYIEPTQQPFLSTTCNAILITTSPTFGNFLITSPIESNFLTSLCTYLCVEVCVGLRYFGQAINWFRKTYFYTRMVKHNPHPSKFVCELLYTALRSLEAAGLIEMGSSIYATYKGAIVSKYYLSYDTPLFNIHPSYLDANIFDLIGSCREFKNLRYADIDVPIPCITSYGNLFQAYIGRYRLDDMYNIMPIVSENSGRLFHALLEICLHKGIALAKTVLCYCKSIEHRFFPYQSPLRHFISDLNLLKQIELLEIPYHIFKNLTVDELRELGLDGSFIRQKLDSVPTLSVTCKVHLKTAHQIMILFEAEHKFSFEGTYFVFVSDQADTELVLWDRIRIMDACTKYYGIRNINTAFLNISVFSEDFLYPEANCVLDLRNISDTKLELLSAVWDCKIGTQKVLLTNDVDSTLLRKIHSSYQELAEASKTPAPFLLENGVLRPERAYIILAASEEKCGQFTNKGKTSMTYSNFLKKKDAFPCVIFTDFHFIISNHLIEASLVQCIKNGTAYVLCGMEGLGNDVEFVSVDNFDKSCINCQGKDEAQVDEQSVGCTSNDVIFAGCRTGRHEDKVSKPVGKPEPQVHRHLAKIPSITLISSSFTSYTDQINEFGQELEKHLAHDDLVIFPTIRELNLFKQRFPGASHVNLSTINNKGIKFINRLELQNTNIKCVNVHLVGTSYYDYYSNQLLDYSLSEVKRYSVMGTRFYLYTSASRANYYTTAVHENKETLKLWKVKENQDECMKANTTSEENSRMNGCFIEEVVDSSVESMIDSGRLDSMINSLSYRTVPLYYASSKALDLSAYAKRMNNERLTFEEQLACKYSISLDTVFFWSKHVKKNMGLRTIFNLVCDIDEMNNVVEYDMLYMFDRSKGRVRTLVEDITRLFGDDTSNDNVENMTSIRKEDDAINTEKTIHMLISLLPLLRDAYLCLVEMCLNSGFLKAAFNCFYGLQNVLKIFVEVEEVYEVKYADSVVSIVVKCLPCVMVISSITFLLVGENRYEFFVFEEAKSVDIDWEGDCFILCDCIGGYKKVVNCQVNKRGQYT